MNLFKWSIIAVICLLGLNLSAQSKMYGTVIDKSTNEPLISAGVKVFKGTDFVAGAATDFDGNYSIALDPGKYNIEVSYSGNKTTINGITINSGKATKVDVTLQSSVELTAVEIVWKKPIIETDNTTNATNITSEQIDKIGTRNINNIVATVSGTSSVNGGDVNIRGGRTDGTVYFLDGVRVNGRLPSAADIEEINVIKGGLDPQYGDVTGGVIGLTTRGPSSKFAGNIEGETSNGLDPYGYTFINANVSGPIYKKDGRSVVGFRLSGQFTENKDDNPPAFGQYYASRSTIERLSADPIILFNGAPTTNAFFLKEGDDVNLEKANLNNRARAIDLTAKLDVKPSTNVDFTLSGTYSNVDDRFVPGDNYIGDGTWRLLNWVNNPVSDNQTLRGNLRIRHRLGKLVDLKSLDQENKENTGDGKLSVLQNAYYTIQLGYQNRKALSQDFRHQDRFFDYGYVGNFDRRWIETRNENQIHTGFLPLVFGFNGDNSRNPIWANFNKILPEDAFNLDSYFASNSRVSNSFNSTWTGLAANVGSVFNNYSKSDNDLMNMLITSGFDFLPGGSSKKGRHNIQFGIQLEQSVFRSYTVRPFNLWTIGRLYANQHIIGLDTLNICGYDSLGRAIFCNLSSPAEGAKFYQSLRDVIFPDSTDPGAKSRLEKVYVNIDGVSPDKLSLSMFSPTELTEQSIIGYNGYDYLGNKLSRGTKFEDFFLKKDANGNRTYEVAPFSPIYAAGFIGDKFIYKDIIFRVGGRVDYYDANTKVLRDPYSLHAIQGAKTFHDNKQIPKPSTIEDDYKVYVNGEGSSSVKAYRNGDQWYFANGTPANNSLAIFGESNLIYPAFLREDEKERNIRSSTFTESNINESFEDYKPQINWMPRIAFSFPISDAANFYAHYDILVQRPTSNQFVSPLQYYYFDLSGRTPSGNGSLRPSRKIDYEVGFQQKITDNSALNMSAYYNELRDMIQFTTLAKVATIGSYNTYRNLDFGTVKGFNFSYELRRVNNLMFNAAYTLQFADGTGSDPNSQNGLTGRGINIRNIFPFTYDERHRFAFTADYRYGSGKQYNGPRIAGKDIFANTGLNILLSTASGRPYSPGLTVIRFDGSGYRGDINSARLPWNFNIDLRLDRDIRLTNNPNKNYGLNVYFRVQNLLDTRSVIGLYRGSGDAKDDGYLSSSRGKNEIINNTSSFGAENIDFFLDAYNWALLNPGNFILPRRIFVGAVFSF
ncbi:MAG: TonB-dependent receptor [Saprospiraceae bacterium]|nr:TonB-dependent receptor [Saprospiraceae bacterium]